MRAVVVSSVSASLVRLTSNQRKMMLLSLLSFLSLC
jgi:hypothetical protein